MLMRIFLLTLLSPLFYFSANAGNISGTINITAPGPVSNETMMKKLRKELKAPFGLNAAVWQLEIASLFLKTETELLLKSRNVYPERLIKNGFQFSYPGFDDAILNLLES